MIFEVEPTMRCNLRCGLCSHGANHMEVKDDEMTRENWEQNLEHFLAEDELVITGGEPTLYKDLEYMIDCWVEKFNKPVLRITSNAHNWRRWLPLQDRISNFYFSLYPGRNGREIAEVRESVLKSKSSFIDMPEKNFWDVWFAPKDFIIPKELLNAEIYKCGLMENKAVCQRRAWPCCVGGFFSRRIKGVPPFVGSIEIGSPNWRDILEKRRVSFELCRYCFVLPKNNMAPGEHIPENKRK